MSDGHLFSREFLERIKPDIHEGIRIMEKMTNQEINEAVARKLGWEFVQPGPSTPTGYWVREALRDEQDRIIRPKDFPFHPDYCTDISAALEIVGHMNFSCNVVSVVCMKKVFFVQFTNMGETWNGPLADTAPMAVCLAFLKLP